MAALRVFISGTTNKMLGGASWDVVPSAAGVNNLPQGLPSVFADEAWGTAPDTAGNLAAQAVSVQTVGGNLHL